METAVTGRAPRWLWRAALLAGAGLTAYGLAAEGLFGQQIWEPAGWERFLRLAGGYGLAAGIAVWLRPGWLGPATVAVAAGYTAWAIGPAALASAVWFFFSAWMLGRRMLRGPADAVEESVALLLGASAILTAVSIAVMAPVNYGAVYGAALAVPILAAPLESWACLRRAGSALSIPGERGRGWAAGCGLLAFVLGTHWLVALKPEVSSDGLAMHLVIPSRVAHAHQWSYDVHEFTWAVMPMGGDWAFTVGYLLGGEAAARLVNLGFLLVLAWMVARIAGRWVPAPLALLAAALFASSPIVQLVTGSLFIENQLAALVLGSAVSLGLYRERRERRWLLASAALAGFAAATKFGGLAFAVPLGVAAFHEIWRQRRKEGFLRPAALAAVCFIGMAAMPYANACRLTGNPVFPFVNTVFRSPHFDSETPFVDRRFQQGMGADILYQITFRSGRYLESQNGSLGFQYLALLPVCLVGIARQPYLGRLALGVIPAGFLLVFAGQTYLRYIYPLLPLFTVGLAAGLTQVRARDRWLYREVGMAAAGIVLLNLYFLPASSWYHREFYFDARRNPEAAEKYLTRSAPSRALAEYLNREHAGAKVAFLEENGVGTLAAQAYADAWHSYTYFMRLNRAESAVDFLRLMAELGVEFVIAPAKESGIPARRVYTASFLEQFTEPVRTNGRLQLARVREEFVALLDGGVTEAMYAQPGSYDDLNPYLDYRGVWTRDLQFGEASRGSLTYSEARGAEVRLRFEGSRVVYLHTRAANRGIAEVLIDGEPFGEIDLYAPETEWQARSVVEGFAPGRHVVTIRVSGRRGPEARGAFVDIDGLVVE